MEPMAIILVVISALIHSSWNLLTKRSKNKLVFIWYLILIGPIVYFPVFLYFIAIEQIPVVGWLFISLASFFSVLYFYFLGKTYSIGDLSLSYPVVRSSIIFVVFLAVFLLNEQLSITGISGIIIIIIGIYLLHLRSFRLGMISKTMRYIKNRATVFALLAAFFVAFTSIIDKIGISYVSPFVYLYLIYVFSAILYLPIILSKNNRKDIKMVWKSSKKSILLTTLFVMPSYLLILFAFNIDNVSYVIALRQLTIVFGIIWGSLILKEGYGRIRLFASIIMFIGFFLVAIA